MKKFIEFLSESVSRKVGSIVDIRDGRDPEVKVEGYGTMPKSTLEKSVIRDLRGMADRLERAKETENVFTMLYGRMTAFPYKLKALIDVENEMRSPAFKRKITLAKHR